MSVGGIIQGVQQGSGWYMANLGRNQGAGEALGLQGRKVLEQHSSDNTGIRRGRGELLKEVRTAILPKPSHL